MHFELWLQVRRLKSIIPTSIVLSITALICLFMQRLSVIYLHISASASWLLSQVGFNESAFIGNTLDRSILSKSGSELWQPKEFSKLLIRTCFLAIRKLFLIKTSCYLKISILSSYIILMCFNKIEKHNFMISDMTE